LTVSATGSGPLSYQWLFNGTVLSGATSSSLNLCGLQFTNAGIYSVVVSNGAGSATSPGAVVNVAPRLTSQFSNKILTLTWPGSFILQSAPNVTGPYTDLPGAVSPYTQNTAGSPPKFFRLRSLPFRLATRILANGAASLTITGSPGINFIIQASTNMTDWVNLQTNTAPCTFIDIHAPDYSFRTYRVILAPTKTIVAATTPPTLTSQPHGQTATFGKGATLSVTASGSGPFSYQWRFNGVNLVGATNSSLNLAGLQLTNAGLYTVVVSNAAGSVVSSAAVVNVAPVLSGIKSGKNLQLTWPGSITLQSANNPAGPYADVPGAVSPYQQDTTAATMKFFRLRPQPFHVNLSYPPGGAASISVAGMPGLNFVLQATTDFVHWANLTTNTAPCTFVDTSASQYSMRMYRAVPAH
jgi:hypothetical protein